MPNLEIKYKKVSELIPFTNNSKTHNQEQVELIAASISEFGFTNPILIDAYNVVIAGHCRLLAAEFLDLREVPTIELTGLSDTQKQAYVIADNKLTEVGGSWDFAILDSEIEDLRNSDFDVSLLGIDFGEIETNNFGSDFDAEPRDFDYEETHCVIVTCSDVAEQESTYARLTGLGLDCRVTST